MKDKTFFMPPHRIAWCVAFAFGRVLPTLILVEDEEGRVLHTTWVAPPVMPRA